MKPSRAERSAIIITILFIFTAAAFGFASRSPSRDSSFSLQALKTPEPATESPIISANALININTANLDQLCGLHGIGPATAQKIIDFRTELGPFVQIADILDVYGIGFSTFDDIKSYITT